jgi:5-methylcytosine-specific restriction endonuclease McrA
MSIKDKQERAAYKAAWYQKNKKRLRKEADKYRRTVKGRAAHKAGNRRYRNSPKGKAVIAAWRASAKGKESVIKFQQSTKRKIWEKKYRRQAERSANNSAFQANSRAKHYGAPGSWTGAQFLALCKKYGNFCLCCHKKRRLTPDHVIPFCKGGTNYRSNIQPLCLSCNHKKRNKTTDYRLSTTQKTATQLRAA